MPSQFRALLSIDDLNDAEIRGLLDTAADFATQGKRKAPGSSFSVGLLFLSPSLRTRVGNAEAAIRLGGAAIDVTELRRDSRMSAAESFPDTLRTVSGMVDLVVTRTPFALARSVVSEACVAPLVNGGDGGPDCEHPTQALVDLFAIEQECGPLSELHVVICGDLQMRGARSLLKLFNRFAPRALTLVAPPGRNDPGVPLSDALERRTSRLETLELAGADFVYMAGLPRGEGEGLLDDGARAAYVVTQPRLLSLPDGAVVHSPMPVVDEITAEARADPRVRLFGPSDRSVAMRMAVLQLLLSGGRSLS